MTDLKLLERLCNARGVSGREDAVREIILEEIKGNAEECRVDAMGNLLVFKKGRQRAKTKLLLSAHMDEVGLIVTGITESGFLKFETVGGIDQRVLPGRSVTIGERGLSGIIGAKPIHLLQSEERNKTVPIDQLVIDIGAKDKKEAESAVNLGDDICFHSIFNINNEIIKAKAIDDRAGCLVLIEMIKSELPVDMYFSFVVQEEIGLRGATTATYQIAPEAAIVVEATTAADIPSNQEDKQVCGVGRGAVLSFMDKHAIYDKTYYDLIKGVSKDIGACLQVKKAVAGGNDAGAIQVSRKGVRVAALSLPCRYLHSQLGMISQNDLESFKRIISESAKRIAFGEGR